MRLFHRKEISMSEINASRKQPLSPKRKNILAMIVIACMVLVIGASIILVHQHEKNNENEKKPQEIKDSDTILSDVSLDLSRLKHLAGLDYELLSAKATGSSDGYQIVFDLKIDKAFTNHQLKTLNKAIAKEIQKQLTKKSAISTIEINGFSSKEAYQETQKADYHGSYVVGLLQKYTSTYKQNKILYNLYNYESYEEKTELEDMYASTDFEVINATKSSDNRIITADVIIHPTSSVEAKDMIQNLVSMLKTVNDGVTKVNLYTYPSEDDYVKGQYEYQLDAEHDLLIHHLNGQYKR